MPGENRLERGVGGRRDERKKDYNRKEKVGGFGENQMVTGNALLKHGLKSNYRKGRRGGICK